MLTWGFLQSYLMRVHAAGGLAGRLGLAAGGLVGGMLLWDILFRAQIGFSISFLEEMWSRNLANLMMSPLRVSEFVAAMMLMSLLRLAIGIVPVSLLAMWFFGFNLWGLGIGLGAFFANLILTGWAIGLFLSGLLIRYGLPAESLVWTVLFVMMPLACVYYPVAVLPGWLQHVAWALPPTYVFEGLRALLIHQELRGDLLVEALGLNILLFAAAAVGFSLLLESARRAGSLIQSGE